MEFQHMDGEEITNEGRTINDMPNEILANIFEHLDIHDWLPVRATCKRFHHIIENDVTSRKTFDYTMTNRIGFFRLFGKTMTKIEICSGWWPNDVLQLISTYCQPGKLTKVRFIEFRRGAIGRKLAAQTAPYFDNVTDIEFSNCSGHIITDWLASITCVKLRSLSLSFGSVRANELILDSSRLSHLQHFEFCGDNKISSQSTIIALIQSKPPQLKSFHYRGHEYNSIFDELAMYLPNIERLIIGPCTGNVSSHFLWRKFNFFKNLKCIDSSRFNKFSDFNELIETLKTMKNLEMLRLVVENQIYFSKTDQNKIRLHCLNLVISDSSSHEDVIHMVKDIFDFKICILSTGWLRDRTSSYVKLVMEYAQNMEQLVIPGLFITAQLYTEWIELQKTINYMRSGASKSLTIFIRWANECKNETGLIYDPEILKLAHLNDFYTLHRRSFEIESAMMIFEWLHRNN